MGEIWGVLAVDGRLLRVLGRLGLRRSRRARLVTVRVRLRVRVRVRVRVGIGLGNACAIVLPQLPPISPVYLPHISPISPPDLHLRHRAAVGVHVVEQVVVGARRRVLDPRLRDRVRVRVRGWVGIKAGRGCILRAFYVALWAISPPDLPHISPISPPYLPHISPISPPTSRLERRVLGRDLRLLGLTPLARLGLGFRLGVSLAPLARLGLGFRLGVRVRVRGPRLLRA